MEKIKLIKFALLFICFLTMINCKDDNKSVISNIKIETTKKYKEVVFTKKYEKRDGVKELNIRYKNFKLKFRFIEDITLLQFIVDDNIVSNWKQILFNFEYLPDNYDGIRLLFDESNSNGLLLLPGYTEEFPNLIVYEFDKSHFSYSNNSNIKNEDLNKIPFEKLNEEWKKGSFEANKKSNKYFLTFFDASKKTNLNFENSKSYELLQETEIKKYIDKVLLFEKDNSDHQSFLEEFEKRIEKEGFKIIFDKNCDLNDDKIQDKILVFSNELAENFKPSDYEESIVCVSILGKLYQNKNIIVKHYIGNVAVGFNDIKIKDNFFTIEQVNSDGYSTVKEYTTFKFFREINQIILYKYTRIETSRSGENESEKSYNYEVKNFGNILFEDYNSETILEKCKG
ncbi:hypothetical protein [Flavobacterium johnsoniae]|uniref:Hypothetical lipoprotein n=2 Tax=Flavobacterium johnsoniae TaxID=986 RepID=A5FHN4_FLAJ1|nr:hypothetical protein [Flavobacterium johnsoniae]ABQ05290.1 hypothetical lipoprotein [Flavobacterium johnsoniae UW101]WQG82908.1 hypothetical protein SR927_07235 [Flavobacterium johnsoniae UW101]SHL61022.1 hypothetical protein SAMN05444146_4215 [Flavobacterium johnsoniae]